jgi:hypothetical protein
VISQENTNSGACPRWCSIGKERTKREEEDISLEGEGMEERRRSLLTHLE